MERLHPPPFPLKERQDPCNRTAYQSLLHIKPHTELPSKDSKMLVGKDSKQESRWSPNKDKETKVEILAPDMGNAQTHKTERQKTILNEQKEVKYQY